MVSTYLRHVVTGIFCQYMAAPGTTRGQTDFFLKYNQEKILSSIRWGGGYYWDTSFFILRNITIILYCKNIFLDKYNEECNIHQCFLTLKIVRYLCLLCSSNNYNIASCVRQG